jgi:hypothetical protein
VSLAGLLAWVLAALSVVPVPVGTAGHRPAAALNDGSPVAGMACASAGDRFPVHVEVFAAGRAAVVPAGIGIAPPVRRSGAYVTGGSCRYPLVTTEPTGVVWVRAGRPRTLGDLFVLWGQPLGRWRLLGFDGRVSVTVDGRGYRGDPRTLRLRERSQIVVQVGRHVPPHPAYRFPGDR